MTKEDIIKPENLVYQKPRLLNDNPMHYCPGDRKSTRLNSSHEWISYAVFSLIKI